MKGREERKKMLVIRTSALGDVAMTLPVVYSLARQYPELDVYLLTRPFFGRLCINAPANLRVIGVDLKKDYAGLKGLMRLIRELRREKFTYVADFHDVLRSWIISNGLRLREVKGCRSVAGKLGIEEELATISHLDVMVSMDSANQHLASLVGVDAVTVWGSTQPSCGFLGYGQSASNALSIGLACQPCTIAGSPECKRGDMACMRQLPAAVVAAKVVEVLKGKGYFSMKKN